MPWPVVRLAEVCKIVSGATPKTGVADYWDGDVPWATPKDLSNLNSPYIHETPRHITALGLRSCAATVLPPGSVLLSSRAPIGHVAINTVPMATNQGFKSLVPLSGRTDAKYLLHWLSANRGHLEHLGNGATFKEMSKASVARVEIPLPPIEEQRRIANVLDRADDLRTKRRETLAYIDNLNQSVFLETIVADASEWPIVEIGDLVDHDSGGIRTGPFGSQLLHSEFVDDGIAVLGIDNAVTNRFTWFGRRYITSQKYAQLTRYIVHPGDVLITIMGTCGRAAVVPDDIPTAISTKHLCCISLDTSRCLPEFLHSYFLMHPAAREYLTRTAKGAIMSGLNMGIIKAMPIPVPLLTTQVDFVNRYRVVERCRQRYQSHLAELDALFASLQQRAFAGQL